MSGGHLVTTKEKMCNRTIILCIVISIFRRRKKRTKTKHVLYGQQYSLNTFIRTEYHISPKNSFDYIQRRIFTDCDSFGSYRTSQGHGHSLMMVLDENPNCHNITKTRLFKYSYIEIFTTKN